MPTTAWLNGRFNAVLAVVVCPVRIYNTHFKFRTDTFSFLFSVENQLVINKNKNN